MTATTVTTSDGARLHVESAGADRDPVTVLLHGFPDSSHLWRHVVPELVGASHWVLAVDQRGYGRSDAPQGRAAYRMERLVNDVVEVLDSVAGPQPARVVGHDWGAVVTWALAAAHPERVERIVALSVGHPRGFRAGGIDQLVRSWYALAFQVPLVAEAALRARDFALLARGTDHHPEMERWRADLARPGRLTAALNWYRANLSAVRDTGRVACPVLGVWSTEDSALTEAQMTASADHVDGEFRYRRLDGVGHWIPLDAPDRLNPLLLDFLGPATAGDRTG